MSVGATDFDRQMSLYQVDWRRRCLAVVGNGQQNGVSRDWILPPDEWEQALWPEIRKNTQDSLAAYLAKSGVTKHTGVHNLKSSWTLCANLYFPFGRTVEGRSLLAGFLRDHVNDTIESVEHVELEFADDSADLRPDRLLGEAGGSRGSGQTSPDLAFVVNGGRGLVLTENKFVEHSFYACSAKRAVGKPGREANPDPSRCWNAAAVAGDPLNQCHQAAWGREYWNILAPVVDQDRLVSLSRCPASSAGYQLLRQQALAEGIARAVITHPPCGGV